MILSSPSPLPQLFQRQKHSAVSLLNQTSLTACKSLSWTVNITRESASQYPAPSTELGLPEGITRVTLILAGPDVLPSLSQPAQWQRHQGALPAIVNTGQMGKPKWIWITFTNVLNLNKAWGLHIRILCSSQAGKSWPHFPWGLYVLTIKEKKKQCKGKTRPSVLQSPAPACPQHCSTQFALCPQWTYHICQLTWLPHQQNRTF